MFFSCFLFFFERIRPAASMRPSCLSTSSRHEDNLPSHRGRRIDIFPCTSINVFFVHMCIFSLPAAGLSRVVGSGARREPARTPRRKCGPWPRSVGRALGLQSRENWQVTTGRHSEHLEPSRRMQTHIVNKCPDRFRICRSADGSHSLPDHLVLVLECSCLIACRSAAARTDFLATSCSCWCARSCSCSRSLVLVLVHECSRSCSSSTELAP